MFWPSHSHSLLAQRHKTIVIRNCPYVVRSSEANMCTVIGAACGLVCVHSAKLLQVTVKKFFSHFELQIARDPFSVIIVREHNCVL